MEFEFISGEEDFEVEEFVVNFEDYVDDEGFIWCDYIKICISFGGLVMLFYLFFSVVVLGF